MVIDSFSEESSLAISTMRIDEAGGFDWPDLLDGNTIPRLCLAAGRGACENTCQIDQIPKPKPRECAEGNIIDIAIDFGVGVGNLVIAAATHDNVVFGDSIAGREDTEPEAGQYQKVSKANAFFFRPYVDETLSGRSMRAVAMRMADCGSVMYQFRDREGELVLGQAHFSRTNMSGPSSYKHELHGENVSWAEYVLGEALDHYGADLSSVKIFLAAAVEGKDFIHHYADLATMERHYPGWAELGFMHPEDGKTEDFDCLIDYRQMIEWQLGRAAERFGILPEQIDTSRAVNTGDVSLGHASHHWASNGTIEHGRDMYIIGVNDERRK